MSNCESILTNLFAQKEESQNIIKLLNGDNRYYERRRVLNKVLKR